MTLEAAIFAALMEHPIIAAQVDGRIYPNGQGLMNADLPYITQEVLTVNRPGTLASRCPSENPIVQLTCWGRTKTEVGTIMNAIDEQMERRKKDAIRGCTHSDFQSEPLPETPNQYADSSTWNVWYTRV